MNYATGVGIYLAMYALGAVLPLLFLSGGPFLRLLLFSIPVILVGPRIAQRMADGSPLLPQSFRAEGGFLLGGGQALVWIGHFCFFGAIGAAIYYSVGSGVAGAPFGLLASYAFLPYLVGIVLVEVSFRSWSRRLPTEALPFRKLGTYTAVGLILAAHLLLALSGVVTGERVPDLLSYSEREALARGNGYAREVQRAADRFFTAQGRMPCADDSYIDVDALLGGVNKDMRQELTIDLVACGQFVVTIHRTVDGVADGRMLFRAEPGDADAGQPLVWKCSTADYDRIERHTNGRCTHDASLSLGD